MSMLKRRNEFLDLYKQSGEVFEPSKPTQESDNLGFTYTNKPEKLNDAKYVELIFRKFDIEGWKFLQTNPNGTHTFQCISCKCAFALPDIDSIANYPYCPSCAKYMRKSRG